MRRHTSRDSSKCFNVIARGRLLLLLYSRRGYARVGELELLRAHPGTKFLWRREEEGGAPREVDLARAR
jgi:hypothetical protein